MKRAVRFVALFVAGFLLFPLLASAQSAPRPSCSMSATPSVIQKGATFNLRWQSSNATAGSITGLGSVGPNGVQGIIVTRPTLFTGTFWGAGGTTTCQTSVSFEASGVLPTPAQQLPTGEIRTVGSVQPPGTVEIPTYTPNTSQTLPSAPTLNQDTTPSSGLVPCSGLDCQACHLAKLSQNVINFLVGLSIPIAAAMFAWAGVLMFTAGDSSGKIQKAKDILRTVLVGFLIVLCAWLVIQTVLKAILNPAYYAGWNNIQCVAEDSRPRTGTFSQLINSALGGAPNTTPQDPYIVAGGGVGVSGVGARVNIANGCYEGGYLGSDGQCMDAFGGTYAPVPVAARVSASVAGTAQYSQLLQAACSQQGFSDCTMAQAVMAVESNGRPTVISSAGCVGLMQVCPSTARGLDSSLAGLSDDQIRQRLTDPDYNISLGVKLLAQNSQRFGGDMEKTLAAYNGGIGASLLSKNASCQGQLAYACAANGGWAETRNYVPKVLATKAKLSQ